MHQVVPIYLASDVATSGTFTVTYPNGFNRGDFENGKNHEIAIANLVLRHPEDFTVSFGATYVTVTYTGAATLPANSAGFFQFDQPGIDANEKIFGKVGTLGETAELVELTKTAVARVLLINFGAPPTLDADGIFDGVSVGAAATSFDVDDMKTGTDHTLGVLPVARNLTLVGSASADQVVTVNGYDMYGQAISETMTANSTTPVVGKKAFKQVVTMDIAAGGAASKTLDLGWGDALGMPLAVADQHNILVELANGAPLARIPEYHRLDFQYTEAELDAAAVRYLAPGFAGSTVSAGAAIENTVTTGGAIDFYVGTTQIVGLTLTIGDGDAAGHVYSDTPTAGDASNAFAATDYIKVVPAAAINASAPLNGYITLKRSNMLNGTFIAPLSANTKSTATTADVRGTYTPATACDGANNYSLIVAVQDATFLGNDQYAA